MSPLNPVDSQGLTSSVTTGVTKETPKPAPDAPPIPADLAQVVEAWPMLPDALKAGILAMVQSIGKGK